MKEDFGSAIMRNMKTKRTLDPNSGIWHEKVPKKHSLKPLILVVICIIIPFTYYLSIYK